MTDNYIEKHDRAWRIRDTRVSLDSVIYQFQQGRSPEAIQDAFPTLSLSQVYGAIAYYLDHRIELDSYLAHSGADEDRFSQEIARLFPKGAALKARIRESLPKPPQWRSDFRLTTICTKTFCGRPRESGPLTSCALRNLACTQALTTGKLTFRSSLAYSQGRFQS